VLLKLCYVVLVMKLYYVVSTNVDSMVCLISESIRMERFHSSF
jgi:hypothetical protein